MKSLLQLKNVDSITAFGNVIKYDDPSRTKVDLEEIRHHITNICRYNGARQVRLIHHLALCAYIAEIVPAHLDHPRDGTDSPLYDYIVQRGYAAVHDFPEVYLGDVVSGFKKYLPDYKKFEELWDPYVHDQVGLPWQYRNAKLVKQIDNIALVTEMAATQHPAAERVKLQFTDMTIPADAWRAAEIILAKKPEHLWPSIHDAIIKAKVRLMVYEDKK